MTVNEANLAKLIEERSRQLIELIERTCEAALQGGEHGVRVVWRAYGDPNGPGVRVFVDPTVPYGNIYEQREFT